MAEQTKSFFDLSDDKLALLDLLLEDEGVANSAAGSAILPRPQTDEPLPLSFAQQRFWFLEALTPGSSLFNTPLALQLMGQLHVPALGQA